MGPDRRRGQEPAITKFIKILHQVVQRPAIKLNVQDIGRESIQHKRYKRQATTRKIEQEVKQQ